MKTEKEYQLEKAFAEKWIKALRSGKFKQGNDYLFEKVTDSYCCLGVACKITMPGANINHTPFIDAIRVANKLYNKIPKLLRGNAKENKFVAEVSGMNDNGISFNEIADWIEENVEFV